MLTAANSGQSAPVSEPSTELAAAGQSTETQRCLQALGLREVAHLILHLPLHYEDATRIIPIAALRCGQAAQVEGDIVRCDVHTRPRRQLTAIIADETGELQLRWLHFYPNQQRQLKAGRRLRARGEVRRHLSGSEMIHPRLASPESPLATTLTPVYPSSAGLTQAVLLKTIARALQQTDLSDTLPAAVREHYALTSFETAIRELHTPLPDVMQQTLVDRTHPAWQRIKFDELLAQQLCLAAARAARQAHQALVLSPRPHPEGLVQKLYQHLPFTLTAAQARVVNEIAADLAQPFPMHRLLQGEVGSGKTVVAAITAAQAIAAGAQVALMAPTEILAQQHFCKLVDWLEPLGVNVAWLSGSVGLAARRAATTACVQGQVQLIVGTQALIQEQVIFQRLGLVIVDEQHRFGVGQRLALHRKGESTATHHVTHQLSMSATPIPRTLAMTFLADLDVSILDELPPGRTPIVTKLISAARRDAVMTQLAGVRHDHCQAYWVCPLVEESETLQLKTVVDTYDVLRTALPDQRVGMVHGRLSSAEKNEVMQAFRQGEIDVLVATTVIEVGVDVPNATLMVIEHAERFGLAQLHQLRGRIGRGKRESVCVLLYETPLSPLARDRLRAMFETADGFEIARRDLLQRGPGDFLGARQSGLTLLRFADLETDVALVEQARQAAVWLRQDYPYAVSAHLARWQGGHEDFLRS
jgi:ATP-dependent DNA helicase RecG